MHAYAQPGTPEPEAEGNTAGGVTYAISGKARNSMPVPPSGVGGVEDVGCSQSYSSINVSLVSGSF